LRNRSELLEDLWGPAPASCASGCKPQDRRSARCSSWTAPSAAAHDAGPDDPLAAFAIEAFRRDPARARVGPVQRDSGCTPAQFIRRFEQAVGLTPKRYARVLRFGVLLPSLRAAGRATGRGSPQAPATSINLT